MKEGVYTRAREIETRMEGLNRLWLERGKIGKFDEDASCKSGKSGKSGDIPRSGPPLVFVRAKDAHALVAHASAWRQESDALEALALELARDCEHFGLSPPPPPSSPHRRLRRDSAAAAAVGALVAEYVAARAELEGEECLSNKGLGVGGGAAAGGGGGVVAGGGGGGGGLEVKAADALRDFVDLWEGRLDACFEHDAPGSAPPPPPTRTMADPRPTTAEPSQVPADPLPAPTTPPPPVDRDVEGRNSGDRNFVTPASELFQSMRTGRLA